MKYELYQQVALAKDISEKKLQRGDIATIVEYHPASQKKGEPGYSVEDFNALGETILVTVVPESYLQKLTSDEILHVRSLAEAV